MSRSAALAHSSPGPQLDRSRMYETAACRLLGDDPRDRTATLMPRVASVAPSWPSHLRLLRDEARAPYRSKVAEQPQRKPGLRGTKVHMVAGILLAALAMGAVTPVLARGRAPSHSSVAFSVYADLARGSAAGESPPAIIDVTTTSQLSTEAPATPHDPAPPASSTYDLIGPPSTSVRQIEAVLSRYGSPAVGLGQALYDLGIRYGIDPAYALAFFVHESACGTKGVARFTHSLGNIRWTKGFDNYEGYRRYASWEQGMEDWYKLITDLYINGWNLRTVDAIIPVYAPWGDNNNPPSYIASIKAMVDSWRGK